MDGFQPNSMIKVAVVVLFHWMFVAGLLGGWREDMEKQSGFNVHLKLEQKSMISSLDFYQIRHSRMILFPFPSPPWSNGIDVLLFWIRENETWQIKCAHCTSPKKGRLITYVTVVYIYISQTAVIMEFTHCAEIPIVWSMAGNWGFSGVEDGHLQVQPRVAILCALVWRTAMPQSVLIVLQFTARHASIINI